MSARKTHALKQAKDASDKNCLYLIGHTLENVTPYTHINRTDDAEAALLRHNRTDVGGKAIRETKKAAGHWRLLLAIHVPPSRQIDVNRLMQHWRSGHRTIPHRMLFGIQMASQLMLICHVNQKMLERVEIQSKLPPAILEKISAKLAPVDAPLNDSSNNDDDDDDDEGGSGNARQSESSLVRAFDRYVKQPDVVYLRRHPNATVESRVEQSTQTKVFSKAFLDRLNTLYPVDIVVGSATGTANGTGSAPGSSKRKGAPKKTLLSLSSTTSSATTTTTSATGAICFTKDFTQHSTTGTSTLDTPEQSVKKKAPPRGGGRPRRITRIAPALLLKQQQQRLESTGVVEPEPTKQRRQKKSQTLVNKLSDIHRDAFESSSSTTKPAATVYADQTLLKQYGDMLCDNIADPSVRSKTKSTVSQAQNRCICGTFCSKEDKIIYVSVTDGEPPTKAFMCSSCQSTPQMFERISLDIAQFNNSPSASTAVAAREPSKQTVDQFLGSLLISFHDQGRSPSERAADDDDDDDDNDNDGGDDVQAQSTKKRRRAEQVLSEMADLQPKLAEMHRKLSTNLLPRSRASDVSNIERMFAMDNFE